ncbi:TPA: MBL fold metallo-hydrolase [Bacillus cereus]
MDFYAFPVNVGDSFLLKDDTFNLLVDGGDGKLNILPQIQRKLPAQDPTLNVVLCTHYDEDHISGLLQLFDQLLYEYQYNIKPSIRIKEIWLPDIFPRIEKTKRMQARKLIISREKKKKESIEIESDGNIREQLDKVDFDTSIYRICRLVRTCHHLVYLGIIEKIIFLELTDTYWGEKIDHKIYGINCRKVNRRIVPYSDEKELVLHYTRINADSLVIRYNDLDSVSPNVVFTADSNFKFYIPFNSGNTLVTVPHHGSDDRAHKPVYRNLTGRNFIFVRSSEIKKSRPCNEFKIHPDSMRFCTRCNNVIPPSDQLVHLTYSPGGWRPNSGSTHCSC